MNDTQGLVNLDARGLAPGLHAVVLRGAQGVLTARLLGMTGLTAVHSIGPVRLAGPSPTRYHQPLGVFAPSVVRIWDHGDRIPWSHPTDPLLFEAPTTWSVLPKVSIMRTSWRIVGASVQRDHDLSGGGIRSDKDCREAAARRSFMLIESRGCGVPVR